MWRGTYDNDHVILIENITKKVGFNEYVLPVCKIIRDLLVVLMEQDIPRNYKEKMVNLNTRCDLES